MMFALVSQALLGFPPILRADRLVAAGIACRSSGRPLVPFVLCRHVRFGVVSHRIKTSHVHP
jgi:hypothetical protein